MPKWATLPRKLHLASITLDYLPKSGWQVDLLTGEFYHPELEAKYHSLIRNWVSDDRAEREALWLVEQKAIHGLAERGALRGQFNTIGRDIFFGQQPQFYLVGLGISGLTFKAFAKVRVASSFVCLHVDIGDALKATSKAKRRKAIRYGKPLPQEARAEIDRKCRLAVRHYLK